MNEPRLTKKGTPDKRFGKIPSWRNNDLNKRIYDLKAQGGSLSTIHAQLIREGVNISVSAVSNKLRNKKMMEDYYANTNTQ